MQTRRDLLLELTARSRGYVCLSHQALNTLLHYEFLRGLFVGSVGIIVAAYAAEGIRIYFGLPVN